MKMFRNVLRDKTANNIIVGILVGYSTANFMFQMSSVIGLNNGPGADYYWRMVLAWVASLVVAWIVSWFAE